jgi:hypothetical protein
METPQLSRRYSAGVVPAQHRTEQAGQLMSSAIEVAAGTPADNMDAASLCTDAAEAVVGCCGVFVDRVGAEVGEFVGLQVAPLGLDGVKVVAAPALRASLGGADAIPCHAGSSAALGRECRRSSSSPV